MAIDQPLSRNYFRTISPGVPRLFKRQRSRADKTHVFRSDVVVLTREAVNACAKTRFATHQYLLLLSFRCRTSNRNVFNQVLRDKPEKVKG